MMTKTQKEAIKAVAGYAYNDHCLMLPAMIELGQTIERYQDGTTDQALITALLAMDISESARIWLAVKAGEVPWALGEVGVASMIRDCKRRGIEIGE